MVKLICMESSLKDMEEIILNKKEFINEIAKRTGKSKYDVAEIYHVTYELITEKLIHKECVEIPRIGRFTMVEKNAKGLLYGNKKNMEKKCLYPSFKINECLKKRIKNVNGRK